MAEGRMLKKRISKSKKLGALKTDTARTLYLMILPHLDAEGRMEAQNYIIKGTVCPYVKSLDFNTIERDLKDLHKIGLITLYAVDGEQYLEFTKFHIFNRIDKKKESNSVIPNPPKNSKNEDSGTTPEQCQSKSSTTPPEDKIREVKLIKDKAKLSQKIPFPFLSNQAASLIKRLGINEDKLNQLISISSIKSIEQVCMNGLAKEVNSQDKFTLQAGYIITAIEMAAKEHKSIKPTTNAKKLSKALKTKPKQLTSQEFKTKQALILKNLRNK